MKQPLRHLIPWLSPWLILLMAGTGLAAVSQKVRFLAAAYDDAAGLGLKYPEGVACGPQDTAWVADTGRGRLVRFSLAGKTLKPAGVIALAGNAIPLAVQVSSRGEIFVLDGRQRSISKLSASGEARGALAPAGLPAAGKIVVKSFKLDARDNIYLLDIFSQRVLLLDPEGKYLRQVPLPRDAGFFSDLAVDGQGMIYLLDSVRAAVWRASRESAAFTPLAQSLKEYMNFPTGIAVDSKGLIWVIDQHGSGLVLLGRDGAFLGRKLSSGWVEGQLNYPAQLCVSPAGLLLIADRNNSRVQLFAIE